jgi:hypothetical protein
VRQTAVGIKHARESEEAYQEEVVPSTCRVGSFLVKKVSKVDYKDKEDKSYAKINNS